MRILITNDDGINAPGLEVLQAIATELAGPDGEVWTVAPAFEQSGVGHCISYTSPTMIAKLRERRYAAEGSPADCVLAGLHDVMRDAPPDLVLSGVNRGNNAGENALYSGTLGGAMEGALQGIKAIALSQYLGPKNMTGDLQFEAAAAHGAQVVHQILDAWPEDTDGYGLFWNVNFPPCPAAEVKGLSAAPQGYRGHGRMRMTPAEAPNRRRFLWITGSDQHAPTADGSDVALCLDGWIAATPMRADLTDHAALGALGAALS
ncbi:MAG: 5'/3'-nucleotidase SurE [Rhodobacterales bacterium]|nr:MAG: 5'/3'-nucleotidase SurE [Rhodobacterales bacterium]